MSIVCSNLDCESHKDDSPMFNINVTVDGDYDVAEPIRKIEYRHFVCVYCQSEAAEGGAK